MYDIINVVRFTKICTKCGVEKNKNEFYVGRSDCKVCCVRRVQEYYKNNKDKVKVRDKIYYMRNVCKIKEQKKLYGAINKDKIKAKRRLYYLANEEKIKECLNNYYLNNKDKKIRYGKTLVCFYSDVVNILKLYEEIKKSTEEILLVRCAYCGSWYTPTRSNINARLSSIYGIRNGENRFYCSDGCKKSCPIYRQVKYPKNFKPSTSREVQPELRQLVLARDDYTCIKCGKTKEQAPLHCHHIEGIHHNPLMSADIDTCVTLCKQCHKEVHKQKDCRYVDMQCKVQNIQI